MRSNSGKIRGLHPGDVEVERSERCLVMAASCLKGLHHGSKLFEGASRKVAQNAGSSVRRGRGTMEHMSGRTIQHTSDRALGCAARGAGGGAGGGRQRGPVGSVGGGGLRAGEREPMPPGAARSAANARTISKGFLSRNMEGLSMRIPQAPGSHRVAMWLAQVFRTCMLAAHAYFVIAMGRRGSSCPRGSSACCATPAGVWLREDC